MEPQKCLNLRSKLFCLKEQKDFRTVVSVKSEGKKKSKEEVPQILVVNSFQHFD